MMTVQEVLEVVEDVCEAHVSGDYQLTHDQKSVTATSCSGETEHRWVVRDMNEDLLHCLTHAFCADLMQE